MEYRIKEYRHGYRIQKKSRNWYQKKEKWNNITITLSPHNSLFTGKIRISTLDEAKVYLDWIKSGIDCYHTWYVYSFLKVPQRIFKTT